MGGVGLLGGGLGRGDCRVDAAVEASAVDTYRPTEGR